MKITLSFLRVPKNTDVLDSLLNVNFKNWIELINIINQSVPVELDRKLKRLRDTETVYQKIK